MKVHSIEEDPGDLFVSCEESLSGDEEPKQDDDNQDDEEKPGENSDENHDNERHTLSNRL